MQKALLVFSGGPDSTAAAVWGMDNQFSIELLTFKFRSSQQDGELAAAAKISEMLMLSQTNVDWTSPMAIFPHTMYPLMHAGTPKDHAEDETGSLLPFGAGLILTYAAAFALSKGVNQIIWGATKDDACGNPDYGTAFSNDLAALITRSVGCDVQIHVPFGNSINSNSWIATTARSLCSRLRGLARPADRSNVGNADHASPVASRVSWQGSKMRLSIRLKI
jgi:7-cyano-7-deazaguanine synthase